MPVNQTPTPQPCGICEPQKLLSGICDYHLRQANSLVFKGKISTKDAISRLYNEAVEDDQASENDVRRAEASLA